jgi:hypothetical protein
MAHKDKSLISAPLYCHSCSREVDGLPLLLMVEGKPPIQWRSQQTRWSSSANRTVGCQMLKTDYMTASAPST